MKRFRLTRGTASAILVLMTAARTTELETSTRHCTDASTLDGPALDARYEAARERDLELSERLGREILEGL